MIKNRVEISRIALMAFLAPMVFVAPAYATDYTVPADTTDTTAKSLSGTDTLTVEDGATLSPSANPAVNWNNTSTAVVINNSGTITSTASGGRAIRATGSNDPRSLTLNNNAGGVIE